MATQDVPRISPQDLYSRLTQGETVVVLDVRTEDALRVHPDTIPGARWLPLADVVQQAASLPRHGLIVAY